MGEITKKFIPIQLDTKIVDGREVYIERNLIFSLNVIQKCVDKFGSMDDILNAAKLDTVKWLATEMLNEDARIWNKKHPEDPKPYLSEEELGLYVVGVQGLNDLQDKVREAMFVGLGPEQVQEVEEVEKNLMTTVQQTRMNGKMAQLMRRFIKN